MNKNILQVIVGIAAVAMTGVYVGCKPKEPQGDQPQVLRITCINNLKQLGLNLRVWEGEHGDQFPWHASTNNGGTRELCQVDKDGFALNPAIHFQALKNGEAPVTPLLLVCPDDKSRHPAASMADLKPENISYKIRVGTNVTEANPKEVLFVCPFDGNYITCDGTVGTR